MKTVLLSCGDALFDLFVQDAASGDAADWVRLAGGVGGSPLNVAIGAARLGHASRYLTRLSSDIFGQRMREHLHRNGVDITLCPATDAPTTLAIIRINPDGSANYGFYLDGTADTALSHEDLPAVLPEDVRAIHFSSYSTAVEPVAHTLNALAEREAGRRLISYDPNLRTMVEPDIARWRAVFDAMKPHATLIKASDEDIASLYGEGREQAFIADSLDAGVALLFITRGGDGAEVFCADGREARQPGRKVSVVDTVGAGDTFQAALLHELDQQSILGRTFDTPRSLAAAVDLEAMLNTAITAAAITCSRKGADLPDLAALKAARG